jgi:histone-lysine N-methyltransferase SUV420H
VYFWTTIRKNRARFSPSRGIHEEEIADILRTTVIVEKDPAKATTKLLELSGLRKYFERLPTQDEKDHFQRHLRKYVNIYMPDCPFEASTTNRYTVDTHEAAVTARRDIKKGEVIKYLSGIQVAMTKEEEKTLDLTRRDFSIVMSSRKKTPSLFLGPARFANHDCNANAKLSTVGAHGMQVVAITDIDTGDEITVSYGTDYFGEDNCECLCSHCESLQRNGWEQDTAEGDSEEEPATMEGIEIPEEPYSLRGKRKHLSESESVSRAQTPDKSPKRRKVEPSKLRESTPAAPTTPRGRRTTREVGVKSEPSTLRHILDVPGIHAKTTTQLKSTIKISTQVTSSDKRSTRTRMLRDSSNDSDHSRTSSGASSAQSSQSTTATSVDEDIIVVKPRGLSITKIAPTIETTTQVSADLTTTVAIKSTKDKLRNDSDATSELSSLSSFEVDEHTHQAVRRLKMAPIKSRCTKELQALLRVSPEPSRGGSRGVSVDAVISTEIDIEVTTTRTPGDYTLTPLLLASKYSRWVECNTCDTNFVQEDAYLTRKECPRCERHSKLYGYAWPKTDKEGKWDAEERIMDHRTVHRFVKPEEEKSIKKSRSKRVLREELLLKRGKSIESTERGRTESESADCESPRRGLRRKKSRLTM